MIIKVEPYKATLDAIEERLTEMGKEENIVFRGHPTAAKFGTVKIGDMMNAAITLELTYVLIEMGGVTMLELDKLNSVYKINGVDLLADIMKQC